ncbi:MAG: glutaredoxin family protein [Polyangiaceae bacterium]|jgi:glutaredoxin
MRCPRHDLALASDGKCVRCRHEEEAASNDPAAAPTGATGRRIAIVLLCAVSIGGAVAWTLHASSTPTAIPLPASAPYVPPSAPPLAPLAPAAVAADPTSSAASSGGSTPLDRAMHLVKITLYSRPASTDCGRARTWLLDHGYTFKERDVDEDLEAKAEWKKAIPSGTVPAFNVDGTIVSGYDPARIQGAIEYAGARRLQR